jgi:hypothetical protein
MVRCPPRRTGRAGVNRTQLSRKGYPMSITSGVDGSPTARTPPGLVSPWLRHETPGWLSSRVGAVSNGVGGWPPDRLADRVVPPVITSLPRALSLDGWCGAREGVPRTRMGGGGDRSRASTWRGARARSPQPQHSEGPQCRAALPARSRRSRAGRGGRCDGTCGRPDAPKLAAMISSNSARSQAGSALTSSANPICPFPGSHPTPVPAAWAAFVPSISITPRSSSPGL